MGKKGAFFMSELRKLIVFLVVISLFMYMIWMNFSVLNKYGNKKVLFSIMISGLGLISVGTFFDLLSELMGIKLNNLISICFTAGAIVFSAYIILWNKYLISVIVNLRKEADSDNMTGVYNRIGFEKVFKEKVSAKNLFYIMVFDLDKTKLINDTFGHFKGDQYITNAANIIREEINENGFVGRTGGDEFVAFLENVSEAEIERIKHLIKKRVSNIFKIQDTQISIGYSIYGKDGQNLEDLLKVADKRMYEDKIKRRAYSLKPV
jgi:diguanylate cyclase (GGDEF)-like protein